MMRLLDISFDAPEDNLALDEVILDRVEQGRACSTLRFWESPRPFVVLGTAQVLANEVIEEHCVADGVPIMRRCTAGGCVLQGPGSLNYALALHFDDYPEVRSLRPSYCFILDSLSEALRLHGVQAVHEGICDLALDGALKVSGNAQRRRRHAILHHGTLMYQPDYAGMLRYLREPEDRPSYRGARGHGDFVGALPLGPGVLREVVRNAFGVSGPAQMPTCEEEGAVDLLSREKYASPAWIRRR